MTTEKIIHGWGGFPRVTGAQDQPATPEAVAESLTRSGSALAFGLGRSYGDAALPVASGLSINTTRLKRVLHFDAESGLLSAESGISFDALLRFLVPKGWFLPVTPGTRFVTLGGAIAHDVHGKNHHVDGSFSRFVRSLDVLLASGEVATCSPAQDPALFYATLAGVGLTGIILRATVQMRRIETAYIRQKALRVRHLSELMAQQHATDAPYAVAWVDCLAAENQLGRGHILLGDHASVQDLSETYAQNPRTIHTEPWLKVPFHAPSFLLNNKTMTAFNTLYFQRLRKNESDSILHYAPYFYPLDAIGEWNKLYGNRGFVQFQCVLPDATATEGLTEILRRVRADGRASFLAVLKRFGNEDIGYLSFPIPGWTLTMDFPMSASLPRFLETLEDLVLHFGGRLYLAKDALMKPSSFRAMYPRFEEWLHVKTRVDPTWTFHSHLADRLMRDEL